MNDTDVKNAINLLENVTWLKNYDRKRQKKNRVTDTWCYSMTFGYVYECKQGIILTKATIKYPEVHDFLMNLANKLNFTASTFIINKNLAWLPHKNHVNNGISLIVGVGSYTGGELLIEDSNHMLTMIDTHNNPHRFNGYKYEHFIAPFEGTMYTIVMQNLECVKNPKKGESVILT